MAALMLGAGLLLLIAATRILIRARRQPPPSWFLFAAFLPLIFGCFGGFMAVGRLYDRTWTEVGDPRTAQEHFNLLSGACYHAALGVGLTGFLLIAGLLALWVHTRARPKV